MRISDWSSDVCSSDLSACIGCDKNKSCSDRCCRSGTSKHRIQTISYHPVWSFLLTIAIIAQNRDEKSGKAHFNRKQSIRSPECASTRQNGRGSCRERVCQYV